MPSNPEQHCYCFLCMAETFAAPGYIPDRAGLPGPKLRPYSTQRKHMSSGSANFERHSATASTWVANSKLRERWEALTDFYAFKPANERLRTPEVPASPAWTARISPDWMPLEPRQATRSNKRSRTELAAASGTNTMDGNDGPGFGVRYDDNGDLGNSMTPARHRRARYAEEVSGLSEIGLGNAPDCSLVFDDGSIVDTDLVTPGRSQLVDTRRLFAIPTNAADPAAADSVAAAELAAARRETFGAPYRAFFGSSVDEYVPGSTGAPPVFDKNNSGSVAAYAQKLYETDKPKVDAEGNAIVDADDSAKIKVLPFVERLAPLVLEKNATHSLFSEVVGLLHEANDQLKVIPKDWTGFTSKYGLDVPVMTFFPCPSCHTLYTAGELSADGVVARAGARCGAKRDAADKVCGAPLTPVKPTKLTQLPRQFAVQSMRGCTIDFFLRPGFAHSLQCTPLDLGTDGRYTSVWHGSALRDIKCPIDPTQPFFRDDVYHPVSGLREIRCPVQYNVDWFKVADGSSSGGIYVANLSLPIEQRHARENRLPIGLMPGPSEPSNDQFNHYLLPFVNEMYDSYANGWEVTITHPDGVTKEVVVLRYALVMISADQPALRKCAGCIGHMATTGCYKCDARTRGCGYQGAGELGTPCDPTTWHENALRWMRAESEKKRKEEMAEHRTRWSAFLLLPTFDPTSALTVDVMHNVLLGMTRRTLKVWMDADILKPAQLKAMETIYRTVMTFPSDLGRFPSTFSAGFSGFSAHEMLQFMLYFSNLLFPRVGVPAVHVDGWMRLVKFTRIVLNESFTEEELNFAQGHLVAFLEYTELNFPFPVMVPVAAAGGARTGGRGAAGSASTEAACGDGGGGDGGNDGDDDDSDSGSEDGGGGGDGADRGTSGPGVAAGFGVAAESSATPGPGAIATPIVGRKTKQKGPKSIYTINAHLALHIVDVLRQWGPVHNTWCFAFERYNGELGNISSNNRSFEIVFMRSLLRQRVLTQVKFMTGQLVVPPRLDRQPPVPAPVLAPPQVRPPIDRRNNLLPKLKEALARVHGSAPQAWSDDAVTLEFKRDLAKYTRHGMDYSEILLPNAPVVRTTSIRGHSLQSALASTDRHAWIMAQEPPFHARRPAHVLFFFSFRMVGGGKTRGFACVRWLNVASPGLDRDRKCFGQTSWVAFGSEAPTVGVIPLTRIVGRGIIARKEESAEFLWVETAPIPKLQEFPLPEQADSGDEGVEDDLGAGPGEYD